MEKRKIESGIGGGKREKEERNERGGGVSEGGREERGKGNRERIGEEMKRRRS